MTLSLDKSCFPAISRGSHGEVEPVGALGRPFDEQFVIVALRAVGNVEQDGCIADGLFDAQTTDIHGTARQVVRPLRAPDGLVHRLRAEA